MFNIFTIAFFAIGIGIFLAIFITRTTAPDSLQLVPPEDDTLLDPKEIKALEFSHLFQLAEKLCQENGITVKEKTSVSEKECYWICESTNDFFFGNYVLGFYKTTSEKNFVSLRTILEFKDFVKSNTSTKGLFFATGYFTKDVLQPLEGPKVSLYNRLRVLNEFKRLGLKVT